MKRTILIAILSVVFSACDTVSPDNGGNGGPAGHPDSPPEQEMTFVHPGITATGNDIARMKDLIERNVYPAAEAWRVLRSNPYSSSAYELFGPFEIISRDSKTYPEEVKHENDMTAAYLNALMYVLTDEEDHALKALEILTGYAGSLKEIDIKKDIILTSGFASFHLASAAELLRYTYDVPNEDIEAIEKMFSEVFIPVMKDDLEKDPYHIGNQDAVGNRGLMAMAVFLEDEELYRWSKAFFMDNPHNGCVRNYINADTGQCQESGRDQRHAQLGLGAMAQTCEIAHKQGDDDLYSAHGNLLLKGFDYTAQYNLGLTVPFKVMADVTGRSDWTWKSISPAGRGDFLPYYEIIYNHYAVRKGLKSESEMTLAVLEESRPETILSDSVLQHTFASLVYYLSK